MARWEAGPYSLYSQPLLEIETGIAPRSEQATPARADLADFVGALYVRWTLTQRHFEYFQLHIRIHRTAPRRTCSALAVGKKRNGDIPGIDVCLNLFLAGAVERTRPS